MPSAISAIVRAVESITARTLNHQRGMIRTLFPLQVLEESEEIKQALRDRNDERVIELLDQFA